MYILFSQNFNNRIIIVSREIMKKTWKVTSPHGRLSAAMGKICVTNN